MCLTLFSSPLFLRDTHIRQLKIFGPRSDLLVMGDTPIESFKTVEMLQYAVLRWLWNLKMWNSEEVGPEEEFLERKIDNIMFWIVFSVSFKFLLKIGGQNKTGIIMYFESVPDRNFYRNFWKVSLNIKKHHHIAEIKI